MRSLMFCIAQPKFAVNKIGKNEISGAFRAYGGPNVLYWILVVNTRIKTSLWRRRLNGMIIIK